MITKMQVVYAEQFKLDGGAMFGVVPKSMWNKLNPADENNMCSWALRCLYLETDTGKKILVDCGIGNKQTEKFKSTFYRTGNTISEQLAKLGIQSNSITDVFLSHLHFDHCGGAVSGNEQSSYFPTFEHARYWSNKSHYDWAYTPNEREKNSFLKENFVPLLDQGILRFIPEDQGICWEDGIHIHFMYGHSHAMMALEIDYANRKWYYCADLFPSSHHVALPYIMAYDVAPLQTLKEKTEILHRIIDQQGILIFEHDPIISCSDLKKTESGKIIVGTTGEIEQLATLV